MCPDIDDNHQAQSNGAARPDREFALYGGEPLAQGLRRVVLEQVDGAIALLEPQDDGLSERAVHESRKALKRLRALARLLRDQLGPERFETENAALRDAGRRLARARDAEVLAATLEEIMARNKRAVSHDTFAVLAGHLRSERRLAEAHLLGDESTIGEVTGELTAVRERAGDWLPPDAGFDAVSSGLRRVYRQGSERYRSARRDPTIEHLHDWRKRVKDLRHAAEVLEPAHPKRMSRLARRADRLGETLGDDHDLAMLELLAREHPELFVSPSERKLLRRLVRRRRARLQARAVRLGAQVYHHSADAFTRRVARDWQRHAGA